MTDVCRIAEENRLATSRVSPETKERRRHGKGDPGDEWVPTGFERKRDSHCLRHLFRMNIKCGRPLGEVSATQCVQSQMKRRRHVQYRWFGNTAEVTMTRCWELGLPVRVAARRHLTVAR